MAAFNDLKPYLTALQFSLEEGISGTWIKKYAQHDNYLLRVDADKKDIFFGDTIKIGGKTTSNFNAAENFVVLECVDRLLTKGYKPKDITLEKIFPSGHGHSGRLDIFVEKEGKAFLMIECKTAGKEFDKEFQNIHKNGGQLFTYFQNDRSAEILMLYASELNNKKQVVYTNEIIVIEEDYKQTTNVKDFYDRWNKLTKNNGVFEKWVIPYGFQSKALTPHNLKEITQADSGFIFNQFLEILRHNVVSDKPNAFNKIFTLFLCKIYDEKASKLNDELAFQWFYTPYQYEGISYPPDDHISFQKRLTDLYKKGMNAFLDKEVTDISDADFERKYGNELSVKTKNLILKDLIDLRLKKNNEFAIKEVFNDDSFNENAKVVKEVVELLQGYKIRYTKKQQYLSDFFELLLTTGLKQESGQFFTPVPIAQFIIKSLPLDTLVAKKLQKGKAEEENLLPTIIDYAAGSGHFVTESMHELQRIIDKTNPDDFIEGTAKKIKNWQNDHFDWAYKYVYGIEKDYRLVKVGKVGCYLHGDGLAQIVHSDGLGNFTNTLEYKGLLKKADKDFPKENKQFDIVVSNPPYSVSAFKNNARKYYTEKDFDIYDKLTDQSSEIECLFIERTKQLLKDGGIAGIVLPSSILSNTGIYTKTREIILCYFEIVAIVELGSNTFMATGTNTVTLFLRRRNNYNHANIKAAVERFTTHLQDVTINDIEKPVAKYVAHVWAGISYTDYLTLLQQQPNKAITKHDLYKDYWKKINGKTEADKWDAIISIEQEKLLYFILAYPQQIVLVKTGEKNDEKSFLGYEFSNRRGSEGIHPIQRGKQIDECTQLFDPEIFDNPTKASTYIYQAFKGNFTSAIPESLQQNISRHQLVNMLTFDRVEFEKNISLVVKKKVKVESRWEIVNLGQVCIKITDGSHNPPSGINKSEGFLMLSSRNINNGLIDVENARFLSEPDFIQENKRTEIKPDDVLLTIVGAIGRVAVVPKYLPSFTLQRSVAVLRCNQTLIISKYLEAVLNSPSLQTILEDTAHGVAQKGIYLNEINNLKIPLPPKDIQEKIVADIEALEEKESKAKNEIELLKSNIGVLISNANNGESKKLGEICEMKAGKFVSASDIKPKEEKGFYPCFGGNGFRGYTATYTHEGTFSLIGRQGALCGNVCIAEGKFHATEHAVVVTPFQNINSTWLYYQLVVANLNQYATGTAQPGLSVQNLKTVLFSVPSLEEQQKIVAQITAIETQIARLEADLAITPQQKEAVLKHYIELSI